MIQQIENEQIFATVVAVKDEDRRLNFNFSSDGIVEVWVPLKLIRQSA